MAEPPQAGSIVRREDAGGPPERRSVLGRLGLGEVSGHQRPSSKIARAPGNRQAKRDAIPLGACHGRIGRQY